LFRMWFKHRPHLAGLLMCAALIASLIPGTGCQCDNTAPASATSGSVAFPLTLTDDLGRTVVLEEIPQRIVSLAPSNTEILYALGLGE